MRDNRGIFPRTFTSNLTESKHWLRVETGISLKEAERKLNKKLPRYQGLFDPQDLIELRDEIRRS